VSLGFSRTPRVPVPHPTLPVVTRSLRFRLPALLMVGIVLGGVVAAAIALRLFQDLTRDESLDELRREASGITQLYADAALRAADEGAAAPDFAPTALEEATGDSLFYVGAPAFPGQDSGLDRLPESALPPEVLASSGPETFTFTPPGESRQFLAASEPLRLEPEAESLGLIVVAKPEAQLRDQWFPLLKRLIVAFVLGSILAGLAGWWMSRRITGPVLALARASDEIAAGNYAVRVSVTEGPDEITHLAERFNEMAARLGAAEERERQFLMSVSHELRTPLTAIRGHADALRDGLIDDPELVAASLDVVTAEAMRLERLVGDIVDLAKLRAHRFTVQADEVEMERLVGQAAASFEQEAQRRAVDFSVTIVDASTIVTDGDRVLQIIVNLLSNAFRWTPEGGTIRIVLARDGQDVTVAVEDSGPGIDADEREEIFSPFVSADRQGTGLGLPIARELAGALGGSIELESAPGRGSRFRLRLPLRRVAAGPRP
jgi:two-component system, OmpR family, sensor kinase